MSVYLKKDVGKYLRSYSRALLDALLHDLQQSSAILARCLQAYTAGRESTEHASREAKVIATQTLAHTRIEHSTATTGPV